MKNPQMMARCNSIWCEVCGTNQLRLFHGITINRSGGIIELVDDRRYDETVNSGVRGVRALRRRGRVIVQIHGHRGVKAMDLMYGDGRRRARGRFPARLSRTWAIATPTQRS